MSQGIGVDVTTIPLELPLTLWADSPSRSSLMLSPWEEEKVTTLVEEGMERYSGVEINTHTQVMKLL